MSRFLQGTRYLILVPIVGLAIAAAAFFIFGGIGLISLLIEVTLMGSLAAPESASHSSGVLIFEVVEFVHTFLVGTVLYITAIGLYQLFIDQIPFRGWLRISNTEELETNLIGVTVVVLAVNFMGAIFTDEIENLLQYGAGIALPIAALGIFVGLRAWAQRLAGASEHMDSAGSEHKSSGDPE